jgi:2-polyprenyl-3-methyl-5-hydroxy-6-metoxy-1,4-benzoquinol methylase
MDRSADSPRYDFDGIDLDAGGVHAHVVHLVDEGSRVLELGPATGYMSRVFEERGCAVVGIEFDPAMAERASEFCERMIVGDLDVLDLEKELGDDRFDAIVAADVIEHLKDPLGLLRRLSPFLDTDGCFVISVPNVAHGSVRLALLAGHFEYQPRGLLDSTHLRFFTRETFGQLLDEAELGLLELHRHEQHLGATEVEFDSSAVPPGLQDALEADPDALTYQFVAKAVPLAHSGLREAQGLMREVAEERIGFERDLTRAKEEQARREAEIERWEERHASDTAVLRGEIEHLRAEVLRLQVRLDRVLGSPPGRAYAALQKVPGMRALRRRRSAGFDVELEQRTKLDA